MLQGITAFFPHGQSCALCISAGTVGMGQMVDREKKEDTGSSAQEDLWPLHMDLLIFGVDVVQHASRVFSLYPLSRFKRKKTTEQRV